MSNADSEGHSKVFYIETCTKEEVLKYVGLYIPFTLTASSS